MKNAGVRGAVFLDRDGTIISDTGYVHETEAIELIAGVGEAIQALNRAHLLVLVVSNQSGVGQGLFPEQKVAAVHGKLDELLQTSGASIDSYYYCPHRPEEGCLCRKPAIGMFLSAQRDFSIDSNCCWMVGDKRSDMEFARNCGMVPLRVQSNHGPRIEDHGVEDHGVEDYQGTSFNSLVEASAWILQRYQPASLTP